MPPLSKLSDEQKLKVLETYCDTIRQHMEHHVSVMRLLCEIKESGIFRLKYGSWAEFVQEEFGHTKRWADYQISSYKVLSLPAPPKKAKPQPKPAETPTVEQLEPIDVEAEPAEPQLDRSSLPDDCTIEAREDVLAVIAAAQTAFGDIVRRCQKIQPEAKALAKQPMGRYLDAEAARIGLRNAINVLKAAQPVAPCPYCRQGELHDACDACDGLHFVSRSLWIRAPKGLK